MCVRSRKKRERKNKGRRKKIQKKFYQRPYCSFSSVQAKRVATFYITCLTYTRTFHGKVCCFRNISSYERARNSDYFSNYERITFVFQRFAMSFRLKIEYFTNNKTFLLMLRLMINRESFERMTRNKSLDKR